MSLRSRAFFALAAGATFFAPQSARSDELSLESALAIALENNADFVVLKKEVSKAAARVDVARGTFIPRAHGELRFGYDDSPGAVFAAAAINRRLDSVLALEGRFPLGLTYRLEWITFWENVDGLFTIYQPFQGTSLRLVFTQPLLKNASAEITEAPIVIASLKLNASQKLRRVEAERLVAEVEVAYWMLVAAYLQLGVRREAIAIAEAQARETREQRRLGSVADVDVVEADAEVERRRAHEAAAEKRISEAERTLRPLLQSSPAATSTSTYVPTTEPFVDPRRETLEAEIETAERERRDLAAAESDLEASEVARAVAKNALWPSVDLVGSVGVQGVSGTLSRGYGTASFNTPTRSGITGDLLAPYNPDPRLQGDFLDMYKNLRYPNAFLGVRVEVPLDNLEARANLDVQEAEVAARRSSLEGLKRRVHAEVATARGSLEADLKSLRATEQTVRTAEDLLARRRHLFSQRLTIAADVFRATSVLIRARLAHTNARVNAAISSARLAVAQGTYLDLRNIALVDLDSPSAIGSERR